MYYGTKLDSVVLKEFERISTEEGFVKLAEKKEEPASKNKYNVTDEDGEDEVDKAHPDGGTDIALSGSNWGKVETIVEQNNISQQIATSNPTGKLAYTLNVLFKLANAVDTDGLEKEDSKAFEMSAVIDEAINKIVATAKAMPANELDALKIRKKHAMDKINQIEIVKKSLEKAKESGDSNLINVLQQKINKLDMGRWNKVINDVDQKMATLESGASPTATNTGLGVETGQTKTKPKFINQQANTNEVRYFIREIAKNTDFLPEKFSKSVRLTGSFNQAVFYPLAILEKKKQVTLPQGWKNVFFGKKGPSAQETIDAAFPRLSNLVQDFKPGEGVVSAPMGIGPLAKEDIKTPGVSRREKGQDFKPGEGVVSAPMGIGPLAKEDIKTPGVSIREKGLARPTTKTGPKDWLARFRTPEVAILSWKKFKQINQYEKYKDMQTRRLNQDNVEDRYQQRMQARDEKRKEMGLEEEDRSPEAAFYGRG